MPDFTTILQTPSVRALVQQNLLERAFHDALFPRLLFRAEAVPVLWPNHTGDSMIFTGSGLLTPKTKPLVPGADPPPSTYQVEQWEARLNQYADSIDTHMPTAITAIANLFLRNAHQLGLSAGQSLNRIARNTLYNAAMAGHTVADGAQTTVTSLRVKRLNGFTRARNPNLPAGSNVRFDPVSTNNPLSITVGATSASVIGYLPDNAGDEVGPGALTLAAAVTAADRDPVLSVDRTFITRVGGGTRVDDLDSTDILTLQAIRSAIAALRQNNVPEFPDGRFHIHLDPVSEAQLFADPEFQRLMQSLPDSYPYKQFAIGEMLGAVFFRNNECPLPETVLGGSTATFNVDDPFGGELWDNGTTAGVPVHRALVVGAGALNEYYQDLSGLITEAGINGRIGEPSITNNGIEIMTDRIQLILRAPLNRLQDLVSASWRYVGAFVVRTDAASGGPQRFKRVAVIEHGA